MTLLGKLVVPETPAKVEKSKFVLSPIPAFKFPGNAQIDNISIDKTSSTGQHSNSHMLFSSTEIQNSNSHVISPSKSGILMHPGSTTSTSSDSDPQNSPTLKTTPIWLSSDVNFFLEDVVLTNYVGNFFINTFSMINVIGKGSFAEVLHVKDVKNVHYAVKRTVKPFTGVLDRYFIEL